MDSAAFVSQVRAALRLTPKEESALTTALAMVEQDASIGTLQAQMGLGFDHAMKVRCAAEFGFTTVALSCR
jgi:hypothetical protein